MSENKILNRIIRAAALFIIILTLSSSMSGCSILALDYVTPELGKGAEIEEDEFEESDDSTHHVAVGSRTAVDPASLSPYSGSAFTVVNDNIPCFSAEELTEDAYESYSDLDSLGRCGAAVASCGLELMPTVERGNISSVYPSGWVQAQYDFVSGKSLYNRSHLIGWQLSGEDANEKNLVTGTRYMNAEGMLPFENMIADYIKETGNHVAYRVTPIFEGNNLVCSGVQMEAYSVEDDGDGICFNVYCYNVQPGVVIDYATGESRPDSSSSETSENEDSSDTGSDKYILNTNSKKIHKEDCESVERMSEKNKQEYTGDIEDLLDDGYTKCGECLG